MSRTLLAGGALLLLAALLAGCYCGGPFGCAGGRCNYPGCGYAYPNYPSPSYEPHGWGAPQYAPEQGAPDPYYGAPQVIDGTGPSPSLVPAPPTGPTPSLVPSPGPR